MKKPIPVFMSIREVLKSNKVPPALKAEIRAHKLLGAEGNQDYVFFKIINFDRKHHKFYFRADKQIIPLETEAEPIFGPDPPPPQKPCECYKCWDDGYLPWAQDEIKRDEPFAVNALLHLKGFSAAEKKKHIAAHIEKVKRWTKEKAGIACTKEGA